MTYSVNPLKGRSVNWSHSAIQVYLHSPERQSARMSEIKNVG